jgi:hypothetical protein
VRINAIAYTRVLGTIMERSNTLHLNDMKYLIPILILISVSSFAQDTLPIYSHQYLVEKDLNCCKGAKDQLKCIDSLIYVNKMEPNYSGKIDRKKVYLDRFRKLLIYNFYAGLISGSRGNLELSFSYYDSMKTYLDTLNQNWKGNEFKNLMGITLYYKTEFCAKTYYKDTVSFNRCNCKQFFPEHKDESLVEDTINLSIEQEKPIIKYPNWGEFYINDTLRVNKRFVSDSASIIYFNKILKPIFQSKLLQNPVFFEMLGDPTMKIKRDTLIYKLSTNYKQGKYERKCELVFTTSQNPKKFELFIFILSNLELPGYVKNLELYIPIVVTTENSKNINNAHIYDDHFLMVIKKIPLINPK